MIDSIEMLGLFATALSSIASIPQVYRILKTRNADSVSTETYLILTLSYIAWGVYGYQTGAVSLVLASCITLITSAMILGLKLKLWIERNQPEMMKIRMHRMFALRWYYHLPVWILVTTLF